MQDSTTGPGKRDQHNMTRDSLTRTCPCPGTCGVPPKRTRANGVRAKKHLPDCRKQKNHRERSRSCRGNLFFCRLPYRAFIARTLGLGFSGPVDFAAAVDALARGSQPFCPPPPGMRNLSACNGGQLQTVSERMMVFEILRVANVALFVPAGKATFATRKIPRK